MYGTNGMLLPQLPRNFDSPDILIALANFKERVNKQVEVQKGSDRYATGRLNRACAVFNDMTCDMRQVPQMRTVAV